MRRHHAVAMFLAAAACARTDAGDTEFAAMQQRGQQVMGVDQFASRHVFENLPDGGRIVLDRMDPMDTTDVRTIRQHMRDIADAFSRGDFQAPGLVHAATVPGTAVMSARRVHLRYTAVDRPAGAEVRIVTADSVATTAVHEFLAFQRREHRAAGHEAHVSQ